jgi:hypothetical protein
MGFSTQRMANAFPLWAKIRRDPSSVGQRLFSAFAEMTDEHHITSIKIGQDAHLLKHYLGVGACWGFSLDDEDVYPLNETSPGVTKYTYPTVVGTVDDVDYTCARAVEIIEFLSAPPDRLISQGSAAYSSLVCWSSSSPYTFVDPPWPERLCVLVENSTFYARNSKYQDRQYSGRHTVIVTGTDENDVPISEYVMVPDDGTYYTRNIFKTVSDVVFEGFDGDCTISWFAKQNPWEVDPYRVAVLDDFEGQLRLSLSTQVVDSITYSYVEYSSSRLKLGEEYRRPSIEAPDNTEILAEVVLLDSSGDPYTAVDLAINHETSKLYVLDAQGRLHVYDHELSAFEVNDDADVATARTHLELVPLRHRAKYGDTEYIYTDFQRNRFPIAKVQIKRIAPDGTTEYLQTDKSTWSASSAWIVAPNAGAKVSPEKTWSDFRFATTYNQVGQWEYSCTTVTSRDTTTATTAVLASYMEAERSLDTEVVDPEGLMFSQEGYVAVCDATDVHWFSEASDTWLADVRLGQVLLRSQYDQVEVSY